MNRKTTHPRPKARRAQYGLGVIMAIAILVVLAALAGALVHFGTAQQIHSAQDMLTARAEAAVRAGSEWGQYQALQKKSCAANTTLDLRVETGFRVTVDCTQKPFREGESSAGNPRIVNVFTITATACNLAASCPPDNTDKTTATKPIYIERQRVTIVTDG
ncbi:MAG: hypothetical protein LBR95_09875 [Azoarcus sp.]|jgi:MSHA biogenesis protein MshP|nr:hypothetical protein [Azoarcus sp.]